MTVTTPVRHSLTRQTALESARLLYSELVGRALRIDDADSTYLNLVASDWDERLGALMRFRSDVSLPEHTQEAFEFLRGSILSADDEDAIMRWVETFPEAISNLLPPSPQTFWVTGGEARSVESGTPEEAAAVAA